MVAVCLQVHFIAPWMIRSRDVCHDHGCTYIRAGRDGRSSGTKVGVSRSWVVLGGGTAISVQLTLWIYRHMLVSTGRIYMYLNRVLHIYIHTCICIYCYVCIRVRVRVCIQRMCPFIRIMSTQDASCTHGTCACHCTCNLLESIYKVYNHIMKF